MGMLSGDGVNNNARFLDLREKLPRSAIVMLDHQRRNGVDGFEQNTEAGKRLHEVGGWDRLIPESMPQYQLGAPAFRLASMPRAEVRLWSSAGFAGGIQPWWHHIGAMHEDRRQYQTAEPIFRWHEANADILVDRQPVADIAVIWSQENHDYHGQNNPKERTLDPYRGVVRALDRAGLNYLPVHAEDIGGATGRFGVLVLPNLAAMSDAQVAAVEAFAAAGGAVIATGDTSLYTRYGDRRPDFALGKLFGVHRRDGSHGDLGLADFNIEVSSRHTYLRLAPELRAGVYGPRDAMAPRPDGARHPMLTGLDEADTLPFGGFLPVVAVDEGVEVLATYIPDFPIYPPETSWMRRPRTDLPAIVARQTTAGARLAWLIADLDRCFARDQQVEHARIIANAVRWALKDQSCVTVAGGQGFVTPSLYRQPHRHILHLNNRLVTTPVPGRQDELIPLGPVEVRLRADAAGPPPRHVALRVSGSSAEAVMDGDTLVFSVDRILDHEVIVIDWA
jgi:hypothetical protein